MTYAHVRVARADTTHYTSYYALMAFCSRMEKEHPAVASRFSVATSVEGRELLGLRIRTGNRGKKIKLVANMHGDETVGREILIKLAEYVLTNQNDADIAKILDVAEIHILPSMNPDGFNHQSRTNARGYDLNRNFPDRFYGQITPLQPETKGVMAWSLRENFTLSLNLHGGDLVANYPFDGNQAHRSGIAAPSPDEALFKRLAHAYADVHPEMRASRRFPGGITNGAKWYVLYGGMQDWNYLHAGDKDVTVEVSLQKNPHGSELPTYWEKNKNSLINFMKEIHSL